MHTCMQCSHKKTQARKRERIAFDLLAGERKRMKEEKIESDRIQI